MKGDEILTAITGAILMVVFAFGFGHEHGYIDAHQEMLNLLGQEQLYTLPVARWSKETQYAEGAYVKRVHSEGVSCIVAARKTHNSGGTFSTEYWRVLVQKEVSDLISKYSNLKGDTDDTVVKKK